MGLNIFTGSIDETGFLLFYGIYCPDSVGLKVSSGRTTLAVAALLACACCSAPAAFFLLRWGRLAFDNAKAASFGKLAGFYYTPLLQFLGDTIRQSPGLLLSLVLTIAALTYVLIKRRAVLWEPDFLALLIIVSFSVVLLASSSRLIRYALPVIVAAPFLAGMLISPKDEPVSRRFAILLAGLVFCGLLAASVPARHRASRESLSKCDAVLTEATKCNARRILMATDSPTFNKNLMDLAMEFWATRTSVEVDTMPYHAVYGLPIEEDFHAIDHSDEVVFQDKDELNPPFTNQRVSEYERYVQRSEYDPIRVGNDLTLYSVRCRP